MKYRCSNGHENYAERLPARCPMCGSSLLRVLSGTSAAAPTPPPKPVAAPVSPTSTPAAISPIPPIAPVATATSSVAGSLPKKSNKHWIIGTVTIVAIGVIVALAVLLGRKDTDSQMAAVAKQYEEAVGVVILVGQKDGQPVSSPIATAWAIDDRVFVSNGHVAQPVADMLANGGSAFIVLNKHPEQKFRIVEAICHPKFGQSLLNVDGKQPVVPAYDVGLLKVDTSVPKKFKIAGSSELRKLDSGYRVAYLGFPMENLTGGGVDPHNPVANMQSGIITSATDYWLSKAPFESAFLLSHNLAATGGSSGSPIFNTSGEVVGVLSAGNIIGQVDFNTGEPTRAPSAAMINFAQRIDVLGDIYPEHSGSANQQPVASESKKKTSKASGGRIIVKWKQNPQTESVKTFMASTFAQEVKTFRHVGGGKLQLLNVPAGKDLATTLAQYKKNALIEYAEPDYVMHMADLPNDPALAKGLQWALHNIGDPKTNDANTVNQLSLIPRPAWLSSSYAATGKSSAKPTVKATKPKVASQPIAGGVDIGAEEGWQIRNSAEDIVVAVVDTGVRYTHEDLAENMWRNPNPGSDNVADDVYGYNAVAKNGNPFDDNGHGTHVAGIIGAVGNNNKGISGVAWKVKIMACKCLNADGSGQISDIIECIEYAIRNGAKIMNCSWGGPGYSRALLEAVQHAKNAGVIMVVAAGNDGADNDQVEDNFPANYLENNIVSVGAIDPLGMPANFSNYGAHSVQLFAPGVDIYSTFNASDSSYQTLSGTSMATPVVTGALALVLASAQPGDNYTNAINRVLSNTQKLPTLAGKCVTGGMLNLPGALKAR